jgi:hypothetical protein
LGEGSWIELGFDGIEGYFSWDSIGFEWDLYIKTFIGLKRIEWILINGIFIRFMTNNVRSGCV